MHDQTENCTATSASHLATLPSAENPTPDYPRTGRLPDNRPHWMMVPSHERYAEARVLDQRFKGATLYADGTRQCDKSGEYFVADASEPELLAMRKQFERETLQRIRACELS